jgi:hypothetical protein
MGCWISFFFSINLKEYDSIVESLKENQLNILEIKEKKLETTQKKRNSKTLPNPIKKKNNIILVKFFETILNLSTHLNINIEEEKTQDEDEIVIVQYIKKIFSLIFQFFQENQNNQQEPI